jgi:lipopolysaccharide transport system ATP-binding protein
MKNKKDREAGQEHVFEKNRDTAISLGHVSKQFKIPHEKKTTIFEKIITFFDKKYYDTFYVLKDINLEVHKGEFLGLIGANGSGKSTLLRIIARIIEPKRGTIFTRGKVVSFIELGVGFQGELAAKENIYLYGAVMGMSRKEITQKYNRIVDFADTRKFMDAKLKNFSSGMLVRLAFSTAIQTNPDILLLDEVLAVGDADFQKKCFAVFDELKAKGTTIIFASHNLKSVVKFCDRTIYLRNGKIVMDGDTDKVVKFYLNDLKK